MWPEVDVGRRGVDAELHPQRPASRQLRSSAPVGQRVDGVAGQVLAACRGLHHGPMLDCPRLAARAAQTCAGLSLVPLARRDPTHPMAITYAEPPMPTDRATAPTRSDTFARSDRRPEARRRRRSAKPRIRKLRLLLVLPASALLALRLDGLRDDDGRRLRPAGAREPRAATAAQLDDLRRRQRQDRQLGDADRQPEPHPAHDERDLAEHQARGHRDRGPALLRAHGRRLPRHRPRPLPGRASSRAPPRAARRSPSSSSRTRSRPRATARSSRSCARRRWPTTSRASGPRRRSSRSTSTRSTSATAPTASSRPRGPTSAT